MWIDISRLLFVFVVDFVCVFFFKQKTAYEMRISDWSSDVCSSDLAIVAGLKLVEVQQNVDVTYRLYDYGRPRELHLEDGMVASKAEPYALPAHSAPLGIDARLMPGEPFGLELKSVAEGGTFSISGQSPHWFIPLNGAGRIDGQDWQGSQCWLIENGEEISVTEKADALIARL